MGKLSSIETGDVNDTTAVLSCTRVCMHVLGRARTDVRVMRAATALVEAGFAVTVVDLEWKRGGPVEENIRGVQVKHIIAPNWYTSRRFKLWFLIQAVQILIRSMFRLVRTSADVYHAHDLTALPASYLAARLRRKPLIFDAHELPLSNVLDSKHWHGLITLFSRLLTFILPRCAGVITVSPPIVQEMRKRYSIPEVSLIRNIPEYKAVQKSDRLRQHLGLGPDVRIALYQGGLEGNRGLDRLIRAAPFLGQNTVIVMMGPDIEATQPQLEALIATEGVADRVKILPPVPYTELLDWTASADSGLIVYSTDYSLNIRMCLPNKLFEYLMAGLPILASRLEAVSEVIRTYNVGQMVSSLTPEDIGAAINAMFADPDALDRMRRNALEVTRHELCWEKEKSHLIHLYQDILERRGTDITTQKIAIDGGTHAV